MRASFTTLLALAATALAAHIPVRGERGPMALVGRTGGHGGDGGDDHDDDKGKGKEKEHDKEKGKGKCKYCETTTTEVVVTYTTVCPVTETITEPGTTKTKTYTTTSTVKTKVPTTIVITKTEPPVTKTTNDGKHCPDFTECRSITDHTRSCPHHHHRVVPRDRDHRRRRFHGRDHLDVDINNRYPGPRDRNHLHHLDRDRVRVDRRLHDGMFSPPTPSTPPP
jgi:hypothetical protein